MIKKISNLKTLQDWDDVKIDLNGRFCIPAIVCDQCGEGLVFDEFTDMTRPIDILNFNTRMGIECPECRFLNIRNTYDGGTVFWLDDVQKAFSSIKDSDE